MKGFTLIELLLVLFFFAVLLGGSVVLVSSLRDDSELTNTAQEILSVMRLAQNRTVASEGQTQYGAYFDNTSSPHQYVLFQGSDYASRVVAEDEVYKLPGTLEFSTISLGAGSEVVFQRIQGTSSVAGDVTLTVKADASKTRTVYVQSSGNMEIGVTAAASDTDRTKDSRHVHVSYGSRVIGASETMRLDFVSVTEDILISDYLSAGVFDWEDTVVVDGETQSLRIHTHQFNSGIPNETVFSIHRDRRFNTKPVTIELNDSPVDPDLGTIIQYDAAGVTTPGTSIYASSPAQQ
jgi:type II secretory pathway pseudopilin PulG